MRAELFEALNSEYMLLSKAKGLSRVQSTLRHALRNSFIPLCNVIIPMFMNLLGGSMSCRKHLRYPSHRFADRFVNPNLRLLSDHCGSVFLFHHRIDFDVAEVDLSYGIVRPKNSQSEEGRLVSKKPKKLEVAKPLDAEQIAQEKIPQEMFEQVAGEKIYDQQEWKARQSAFLKDAYLRFKKNKAAIGAAWIILFIILMAIFAPMLSPYHFREQHTSFGTLPPRIPFLENLGIADGCVTMDIFEADLEEYGDAVKEIKSEDHLEL